MKRFRFSGIFCVCVLLYSSLVGCVGGARSSLSPPAPPTSTLAGVSSIAVLDLNSASIELPLDRFGMSSEETQTVLAAQQVLFARCITGSDEVSPATVNTARDTLVIRNNTPEWLYGFWDATFIAANGWQFSSQEVGLGEGLAVEFTPERGRECVYTQPVLEMSPVVPYSYGDDGSGDRLTSFMDAAFNETLADPHFVKLLAERNGCITAAGFMLDEDASVMGVLIPKTFTAEQTAKAVLVEAECSDNKNFAQMAADINAIYQQRFIDENQAELIALRDLIDARVVKARVVLSDIGVA